MEIRELWLLISFLIIAVGAAFSLVISATYIPIKKIPSALKVLSSVFYQKLYTVLVFCLFATLVGLGIYIPLSFDLLQSKDAAELVRTVLFGLYTITLLVLVLSFKKQTLSPPKMVAHAIFSACILVIATQEDPLDFTLYPYILLILALFMIVRYGVRTFNKKL